jgi:hypothetical protein
LFDNSNQRNQFYSSGQREGIIMNNKSHRMNTSSDISYPDLKIRASGDRLMRADVRRALHGAEEAGPAILLPEDPDLHTEHHWMVEIHGLQGATVPIRIEIAGDVVLGVFRGNPPAPDFDFGIYCPDEKGVSRHHAILRPTRKRLYLIDLESKNGTRINNIPISSATVNEVHDGDMISLGVLSFTLNITGTP